MHVLVADDDVSIRNLIRLALELKKYKVTAVRNGAEVLEQVAEAETPFGLVILDLTMPKLGGFETEAELRQHEGYAETPVLFLTGDSEATNASLPHTQILTKPFDIVDLFETVHTMSQPKK